MAKLTNDHIGYLLIVTLAVLLTGMFFSLNNLSALEQGMTITGMLSANATGRGSVTAQVIGAATISLPVSTIALGSLQPGEWNSSENSTLYGGITNWNSTNVTSNITVSNDGSVLVNLEIYSTDQSVAGRGNFTGTAGCIATNNCVMVRCGHIINRNTTGGDCTNSTPVTRPGNATVYSRLPSAAGTNFVSRLNYSDINDDAYIFVNVTIPEDEHARSFTQSMTIAASAAS